MTGTDWLLSAVQREWPFVVRVEVDPLRRFVRGYDGSGDWRSLGALWRWVA